MQMHLHPRGQLHGKQPSIQESRLSAIAVGHPPQANRKVEALGPEFFFERDPASRWGDLPCFGPGRAEAERRPLSPKARRSSSRALPFSRSRTKIRASSMLKISLKEWPQSSATLPPMRPLDPRTVSGSNAAAQTFQWVVQKRPPG